MAGDWSICTVAELQEVGKLLVEDGNHGEYRPSQDEFTESGTAFIRAADMDGGRILFQSASRINETALSRIRKGIGRPCDVLLSHKGTVGKVALAPPKCEHFVCSPQTTFWRTLDNGFLDYRFLFYYLQSSSFQQQLTARKGETDMADYVSLTVQRTLQVVVPSINEQRTIAHILGSLDDKIELNRQMNHTLEAIARALFKSWFVDFVPVRAKAEGRQPYGMNADTATLFPDSFEDSLLGEIPKGWEIKPLDQIADFLNGLALQNYPPLGEDYLPVIKIAELRRGITEASGRASSNIERKYIVENGDVIFSWSGSLEVCIWVGGGGALNQHLFKVTSADYPKWFYYQWIRYHLPEFQSIAAGKATTMGHIQRHHLSAALVVVPPEDTMQMMNRVMVPILDQIINNEDESYTLASIRDALLPKLLSGEIRVKDAEKFVEMAT